MRKSIAKAAGWLLVINGCVKVLGFVREMVIANGFGASALSDAYLAAYTLPYFFQTVLGYAFVSAVLPMMSHYWHEDGDNSEACRLGSTLINVVAGAMLALTVVSLLCSRLLVWLTAPELPPETAFLAAELARIIFPSVIFMSLGMVLSGILNSRYRFAAAAAAPGVASLTVVVFTAWLAQGNVTVVAWGTLAGFVCYFLVTLLDMRRTGFRYTWCWQLNHPAIRQVARDIVPIVLGLAINQIYIILNRVFASGLAEGSISALNYANKLVNLPLGVFVGAITTAAFPALADQAGQLNLDPLRRTVRRSLSIILLAAIPAAAGLMLLDTPIITLLFQSGQFDASATAMTARSLLWMAPSLVFMAINMLIIRVYFALGDVRTPLLTGLLSIAVNVFVGWAFLGLLQQSGLGLANSLAAAVNAGLLWLFLDRRLTFSKAPGFRQELGKICLATLVMTVATALAASLIRVDIGKGPLLLAVFAVVVGAVLLYGLTLLLLRSSTLAECLRSLKRK